MGEQSAEEFPLKPVWLVDEKEILQLLGWFLKRFIEQPNRIRAPSKRLTEEFFRAGQNGDQSWFLLKSLAPDLLKIELSAKRQYFASEWSGARVSIALDKQPLLWHWLAIKGDGRHDDWLLALNKLESKITKAKINYDSTFLRKSPLEYENRSADELLKALIKLLIEQRVKQSSNSSISRTSGYLGLTLRQLSARYFWGDSKFLEEKKQWLQKAFPTLQYVTRKIQVNFYLPKQFSKILFIENLDNYHQLIEAELPNLKDFALVYCAGFKLSAARIRQQEAVAMHNSCLSLASGRQFCNWWFGSSKQILDVYFWGDCDLAALSILKALRHSFKGIKLWQPAYQNMMSAIEQGRGHDIQVRDKHHQIDPGFTGCEYADQVVLPFLRNVGQCFDQEGVKIERLA